MPDIKTIADKADVIINGYTFTRKDNCIHVHVHASDSNPEFIKDHYQEMYIRWSQYSNNGFYEK